MASGGGFEAALFSRSGLFTLAMLQSGYYPSGLTLKVAGNPLDLRSKWLVHLVVVATVIVAVLADPFVASSVRR